MRMTVFAKVCYVVMLSSLAVVCRYTSELLTRQRSFLMIGYPTDMGDYLDTFNRFLRVRVSIVR